MHKYYTLSHSLLKEIGPQLPHQPTRVIPDHYLKTLQENNRTLSRKHKAYKRNELSFPYYSGSHIFLNPYVKLLEFHILL